MRTRKGSLKRRRASSRLGRRVQDAGYTFHDVARLAGVTYRMVQYHVAGRSESPRVTEALGKLLGNGAAA